MRDPKWFETSFDTISRRLKLGKVYIKSYRDRHTIDHQILATAKRFFSTTAFTSPAASP